MQGIPSITLHGMGIEQGDQSTSFKDYRFSLFFECIRTRLPRCYSVFESLV